MPGAVFGKQQGNEAAAGSYLENHLTSKIETRDHVLDCGVAIVIVKHGEMPSRKIAYGDQFGTLLSAARAAGARQHILAVDF
jgi:hypothetical protein